MDGLMADPADRGRTAQKPDRASLWDDDAFVRRVRDIARKKDMSLISVADAAGVSEAWLRHGARTTGRAIEYILRIAQALDVDPAVLMGLRPDEEHEIAMQRLATVAGLACQIYVAIDRSGIKADEDTATLALAMLRRVAAPPP